MDLIGYPGPFDTTLEVWFEGEKIFTLPLYASVLRVGQYLTIDDMEYEIEKITHVLTSRPDVPGPDPPAMEMGFFPPVCKIEVSAA